MHRRNFLAGLLATVSVLPFVPLSSRLRFVNAADYGATGRGIVDERAALQAAIDDAMSTIPQGVVYVPPGVYKLFGPLDMSKPDVYVFDSAGE